MKLLLTILACLVAASAGAQTIKSLGVNTTNGQIVLTNANTVFPINNSLSFVQPEDTAAVLTFTNGSDVVLREINWNNPGVRSALGLGIGDNVEFREVRFGYGLLQDFGLRAFAGQISGYSTNTNIAYTNLIIDLGSGSVGEAITAHRQIAFNNTTNAATTRTNLGLGATNAVTFSNITASGTLAVTGNVALNGSDNIMPGATNAASASSLMTRGLSDDRYLGEMWNASRMAGYATTNPSVTVFLGEPMVTYTNGQLQGPYMTEFIDPEKYAGKTVKVLAYCRVNSTNGGNVQGVGRVIYLTNTAGGPDSNLSLSLGGQSHGTVGVFTNANTDVFAVATSTNQYLIFTSNVGVISNNAKMIIASFGFNRAHTNTTFTNNLYMHAVQVVVE